MYSLQDTRLQSDSYLHVFSAGPTMKPPSSALRRTSAARNTPWTASDRRSSRAVTSSVRFSTSCAAARSAASSMPAPPSRTDASFWTASSMASTSLLLVARVESWLRLPRKFSMGSGNLVMKKIVKPSSFDLDIKFDQSWMEDVTCPICLDSPHNAVLLRCTSYEKGCRPFICDTDQTRSNCLERFKGAHGLPANVKVSSLTVAPLDSIHIISSNANNRPACPLCRGDVIGWFVIDEARLHLNQKKRCCEESCCSYVGNFHELQKHTQQKHPNSRPSEIDPARRVDWENLQQSSDIIDVLSTIHAQVPNSIVLGDYVIEYGDDEAGDDYEVFHRVRRNWWTSCLFCKAFCRSSRGQRIARTRERRGSARRSNNGSSHETFTVEVPSRSVDIRELRFDEINDEYIVTGAMPRVSASRRMASRYRDPRFGHRRSHS